MLCCPYCSMLSIILFSIVTPDCRLDSGSTICYVLLTTLNNVGSTTLFNPVFNNLQQLIIFTSVNENQFCCSISFVPSQQTLPITLTLTFESF